MCVLSGKLQWNKMDNLLWPLPLKNNACHRLKFGPFTYETVISETMAASYLLYHTVPPWHSQKHTSCRVTQYRSWENKWVARQRPGQTNSIRQWADWQKEKINMKELSWSHFNIVLCPLCVHCCNKAFTAKENLCLVPSHTHTQHNYTHTHTNLIHILVREKKKTLDAKRLYRKQVWTRSHQALQHLAD